MTEQRIDYEALAQDALRGVVRSVLALAASHKDRYESLPGKHHFYISFDTTAEGVGMSKRLRDQYPEDMTIVLQHRFWDLQVHEDRFEVKLTFNSIPERLVVPYRAVKVFFDPSVPYGLQFEAPGQPGEVPEEASELRRLLPETTGEDAAPGHLASVSELPTPLPPAPPAPVAAAAEPAEEPAPAERKPAEVVRLDSFRKK